MNGTGEMHLILGTTPHTNWQTVSALFEQAGWAVSTENSKDWYRNGDAVAPAGGRFLLLHSHPEEEIAHSIANGAPPEQASAAWLTAAKAMVNFYKRHRKQTVMVYVPNLLADPTAQLTAIAAHLGLADHTLATTSNTLQVEQAPLLERLIALQLLQQAPGTTTLLAQLEACSLPLVGHSYRAPVLDIDATNQQLETLRAKQAESEELAVRLTHEASLHLATQKAEAAFKEKLNDTLANLRSADNAIRKLEKELIDQKQHHSVELAQKETQQAELQSQLADVRLQSQQHKKQCGLLWEQLHLVQRELEAKFFSHKQLTDELAQIETQLHTDQQAKQKYETALQQTEQNRGEAEKRLQQTEQMHRDAEKALSQSEEKSKKVKAKYKEILSQVRKDAKKTIQLADQKRWDAEKTLRKTKEKTKIIEAEYIENLGRTLEMLRSAEKTNHELERQLIERQKLDSESAEYRDQQDYSLAAANYRIQCLQTELSNFKSGISYKTTAIIKALKARVRSNPANKALKKQAELVGQSGLFNEGWYLKTYPDVAEKGVDPILHYIKFGAKESRNPSPEFDTGMYLSSNPDVAKMRMNPLLHYSKFGRKEGRLTSRHSHPSLPTPGTTLRAELVGQSGLFNEGWYLKTYPDVAEKGLDPIMHYLKFGAKESRNPSPEFDTGMYLSNNPDVAEEKMNPLLHYFKFGQQEGRLTKRPSQPSLPTPGTQF